MDNNNNLWIKSDSGLLVFNTSDKQLIDIENIFENIPFHENVIDIVNYANTIAIAFESGLYSVDGKSKSLEKLLSFNNWDKRVRNILFLQNGNWLIGTDQGLVYWNVKNNSLQHFESSINDSYSLSENNVLSTYQSRDGVIWIGTRNGLCYIENLDTKMYLVSGVSDNDGLSGPNVTSFVSENDSLLWIGTSKGLDLLNLRNSEFRHFTQGLPAASDLNSDYILCLYKDEDGINWIGTKGGGIYVIQPGTFQIERFDIPGLENISVHALLKDKETIWIGTASFGLWKYDCINKALTKYPVSQDNKGLSHSYVFCLLKDIQHHLWIGTPTGGLNMFDPISETFIHLQHNTNIAGSLSNDIILSLYADEEHILWIGTSNGLNKLNIPLDNISWTDLHTPTKSTKNCM